MRSHWPIGLILLGCLFFILDATPVAGQFRPGGKGGGFKGGFKKGGGGPPSSGGGPPGGGFKMDPNKIFDYMARGKDTINVSDMRRGREEATKFLESKGIKNGVMTRELFSQYMETRMKGAGGGSGKGDSDDSDPKKRAEEFFKRSDRNKDGKLNKDEMSRTLRSELDRWDKNRDNLISLDEYTTYIETRFSRNGNDGRRNSSGAIVAVIILEDLDIRPTVFTGANLPKEGLPDWFADWDLNKDGQVSIYEWRESADPEEDPLTNFPNYDRNNDGLITIEEAMAKHKADNPEKESGDSSEEGEGGRRRPSFGGGGFPGGGFPGGGKRKR